MSNSNTNRARVAPLEIGANIVIDTLKLPSGEYVVGVSQVAELFQLAKNQVSRVVEGLLKNDFCYQKVSSELNPKKINALDLATFGLFCYRLAVSGKDKTGKAHQIAKWVYTEKGDTEKVSILNGLSYLAKSNHKALSTQTTKQRERQLQEKYSVLWNCEKEVSVDMPILLGSRITSYEHLGRADLVNDNLIVEIKNCKAWKHAMGQLLAYNEVLERKEMWLILFDCGRYPSNSITKIVGRFGIKTKFIR